MKSDWTASMRERATATHTYFRALCMTILLVLLPLAVWAQDPDEKPVPLNDREKTVQIWTFGVVAGILLAIALFYYFRRAQILNASKHGGVLPKNQD